MTREEAIEVIENGEFWDECIIPCDNDAAIKFHKALDVVIAELQAQQAPVNLDRSRWEGCRFCESKIFVKRHQYLRPVIAPLTPEQELMDKLADLTGTVYVEIKNKFCPMCGRPLTEEVWAELESRVGGAAND